jgi:biopolymer transport protein ExbD
VKLQRTLVFRPELFHLLPLLNVLCLVFVMFSLSTRFTLQPGLSLNLPVSPFTLAPQRDPIVLSITAAPLPTLYVREEKVTLGELDQLLQDKHLAGRPVIIRADRETPYDIIAATGNIALRRGFTVALAFASQEKR